MLETSQTRVLQVLKDTGAVLTDGHFVYTSGRHGSVYVNKDAVYPHTSVVRDLCDTLAKAIAAYDVEVVCGPALGGIILSQWTAHQLTEYTGHEVLGVYAEKTETAETKGGELVLGRGYDGIVAGRRVAIVEDVVTTGGSLRKAANTVRRSGGDIVVAAALVDRGNLDAGALGVPTFLPLLSLGLDSYAAGECPLCKAGAPINTSVGKGAMLRN